MISPSDSPDINDCSNADQRLMHALLLHIHDDRAAQRREERVQAVVLAARGINRSGALSAEAPPDRQPVSKSRTHRLHAVTWRAVSAAAAAIAIAVGAFVLSNSTRPALASVSQILTALNQPGDRTYRISVAPADAETKHGLNGATLYLRDGRQYVLVRVDHKGRKLFDGYDGQRSWRIRAGVLVEARDGRGAGGIPMPGLMAEVPFVDLQRTLESIQRDYVVERFDLARLNDGGADMRHLFASRRSPRIKGPSTIEIWADPQSGTPRRIVFDDAKFQGNPEPRRLTFELASEAGLPAEWFSDGSHVQVKGDDGP